MIRIAAVDDHAVVRAGLRELLGTQDDLDLVAEAASGADVIDLVRHHELDVLLLDLGMDRFNGLDALAAVKARKPRLPVLFYSGLDEASYGPTVLRQGASGYVSKEADPRELMTAIRLVVQGRRYITPRVADLLADEIARGAGLPAHGVLSKREMQVFLHLARGNTVGAVADTLSLSVKSVSTYRSRLLAKLRLRSNSDLTYYALQHGLIR